MTKTELHRLVDELPDESLPAAAILLRRAQDPVAARFDAVPFDDEELSEEDLRAVRDARGEPGVPWSEAETELRPTKRRARGRRPRRPPAWPRVSPLGSLTEDIADKRRLRFGVGVSIVDEFAGELSLQGGVLDGHTGVGAKRIAERELIPVAPGALRYEVQMVGAATRMRLAKPMHFLRQVGRVEIAESSERLKAAPALLEIADA